MKGDLTMSNENGTMQKEMQYEEIIMKAKNGMAMLLLNSTLILLSIVGFVFGIIMTTKDESNAIGITLIILCSLYGFLIGPILYIGLKVLKPNEALVLTLFGKYIGTLKGEGFFYVNPFCQSVNPALKSTSTGSLGSAAIKAATGTTATSAAAATSHKISLKAMTLNNDKQKVNDQLGNPIIISIVVIWKVVNTAQAVFNVDNYTEFLSIQADSALRDIVRLYPYDAPESDEEKSLRGSSLEVANKLKAEIQTRVNIAGLEIIEARITHLSYAQEIASAMLQRQQASAIIAARQMIVEGAVGMVEMALDKLNEKEIVNLDEERKAAMVSNLLVVLCGNKEAQPIVNSGSIY